MSKKHYIIPIFVSHKGCPHQCVFCNQVKIAGADGDVEPNEVIHIVDNYLKTIDSKEATIEVSFFGGTFTAINEETQRSLLSIAHSYKKSGLIHKIRLSTRPDAINQYILNYLKEYGVDIIELGVQSLDDEVLKLAGRGHSALDVEVASNMIRENGFILGHQIMPGLPGTTFEKDIVTAKKSIEMKPDICRIYPSLVIKDTPMEQMYNRGEYIPYTLKEAVEISAEILTMYKENKIDVIRIGLQPTENIALGKDVIGGPFHPAFRELVEGYLINKKLKEIDVPNKEIIIEINGKDISKLYANRKEYFNQFKSNRTAKVFVKVNDKLKRGRVALTVIDKKEQFKV